jgi:tape measure domain-containing protein
MVEERLDIRTRLIGMRQYIRDMFLGAKATQDLQRAVAATGRSMHETNRRSFLMNQTLFTMRRYVYAATLGLTGMAAAAAFMGVRFDASMERSQIAFTHLLGSEQAATQQLQFLFQLARDTAFEFQPLARASQQMLAFGFSLEETNRTFAAVSDAISILNLSPDVLDRIIYAFSQMQAAGKITGEELRQLKNAGVPAAKYLAQELGLTADAMQQVGDLGIDARTGIAAIVTGLQKEFEGGAELLADTFTGRTLILRDAFTQMMGALMMAPFALIAKNLPNVITAVQELQEAAMLGGTDQFLSELDRIAGASGLLELTLRSFMAAAKSSFELLKNTVFPVLKPFIVLLLLVAVALYQVTTAINNFIMFGGQPMIWILRVLVFWWIAETIVMKANLIWKRKQLIIDKLLAFWKGRLAIITRLLTLFTWKNTTANQANNLSTWQRHMNAKRAVGSQVVLTSATATGTGVLWGLVGATWAFTTALLANPITWVVLGILALSLAFIYLKYDIEAVDNAVDGLFDKFRGLGEWIGKNKHVFDVIPGGRVITEGIGALGPLNERFDIFGGGGEEKSVMKPNNQTPEQIDWTQLQGTQGINIILEAADINMDGRKVGEAVFKHRLDRQARR